ncbi:MAG: hypothetical protein C0398_01790 [Coprothermobacter sp.]|nr:hypothetical protein [Coprothermobacter sp.]
MRVARVDSWKVADVVVKNGVWGSNRSRFSKWDQGETMVLLVGKEGVLVATVSGKAFTSDQMIWEDDLYEYRIPVHIEKILRNDAGAAANQSVRKALATGLSGIYGAYIMSQSKLPKEVQELVKTAL